VKKALIVAAIAAILVAVVAAVGIAGAAWMGERRLGRKVEVRVVPVAYARDPASLKLGKHLFESRGCAQCHGADGRGIAVAAADGIEVRAPNITRGPGGVVSDYNEGDWVRAIRHGVSPAGRALMFMPSDAYNRMHDAELAALVAYVRSLPPVAGEAATIALPLAFKARYGLGMIRDASEKIDHRKPPPLAIAPAASAEFGAYLAPLCTACHGATVEPMERYDTLDKFVAMMRTGRRPDGAEIGPVMPFLTLRNLDDVELAALYAHFGARR
jgi:mono/diheme cytochrome c family protein